MSDYIKALRRLIGTTKIIVPGVRALVFDETGRLLLGRQRLFGSWALPHGCIELGESASAALAREMTEETGLRAIRAEPFGLYSDPKYSVVYPNGDEVQTLTMAFVVHEWEGTLRPDGDEVVELGFFPLEALPSPLYPIHMETIDDYRRSDGGFIVK
ncbi:MAG TPA: NUDIX domain-containing protein [Candidatus Binatia bacterium]|nr:NUDIX domain-containing protein [Candidatus Binatia bacterium]